MNKAAIERFLAFAFGAFIALSGTALAAPLTMPGTDGASVVIDKVQGSRIGSLSLSSLSNGDAVAAWDVAQPNGFMVIRGGMIDGEVSSSLGFDLVPYSVTQKNDVDVLSSESGFLAAWVSRDAVGAQPKIVAQRFGLDGAPLPFGSTNTPRPINQPSASFVFSPVWSSLGPTNASRSVLIWSSLDVSNPAAPIISTQRLHKDGALYGTETLLASAGAFSDASRLTNQRVVVVWTGSSGVSGRVIGAPGDEGSPFSIASSGDDASVVATADGGFIVLWKDYYTCASCTPAGTGTVMARRFNASGVASGAAFKISEKHHAQVAIPPADGRAPSEDDKPKAILLTNGQILAAWEGQSSQGQVIAGRLIDAQGSVKGGELVLSDSAPSQGLERPDLASLSGKRLALAWVNKSGNGAHEVRLRILSETALSTMAAATLCKPPTQGMVFWAPFDDGVADVIAGNNPVLSAAAMDASAPPGRSGRSLKLAKGGSAVYSASAGGKQPFLFATGDFSVEMWVKLPGHQPNAPIASTIESANAGGLGGGSQPVGIMLSAVNGQFVFAMSNGLRISQWVAPPFLADDRWHHIAVSVDRDGASGGLLFVDGKVAHNFDPRPLQGPMAVVTPLVVGNDPKNNKGAELQVDELVIYHRALNAAEVSASVSQQMCNK